MRKVIVAAPVKEERAQHRRRRQRRPLRPRASTTSLTAASCTTNCLAPVVKVIHEGIGIRHGSITTLHDMTNTQTIVDAPHKDLRRARAASLSLIPTTTGSATAIGLIFPELQGKLDGLAVRVPLLNASLTDCVFEVARPTTVEEVNGLLKAAADGPLAGHPRLRGAPAGLGRLQGRPALGDRRRALDDGHRRHAGEGPRLVRQRVGLREPAGRAGAQGRAQPAASGTMATPAARRRERRPAQLRARHRRLLGRHAHRRRDPHAGALLLLRARLHARSRSPRCSSSTRSSASSPTSSAAGSPPGSGCKATLLDGPRHQLVALGDARRRARRRGSSVPYVMVAQALSGIAKDLTKMSSKSAVKLVVPEDAASALYSWVAILTGSKNALKGVGFFLGGLLLTRRRLPDRAADPRRARARPRWSSSLVADARRARARPNAKAKFRQMFSNNRAVNVLAAARFFLFASRDVWFVVGLPGLPAHACSAGASGRSARFLARLGDRLRHRPGSAPRFIRRRRGAARARRPHGARLAFVLAAFPAGDRRRARRRRRPDASSSSRPDRVRRRLRAELRRPLVPDPRLHRRRQGRDERRLLLHGQRRRAARGHACSPALLYQWQGLEACLWASVVFVLAAGALSLLLPRTQPSHAVVALEVSASSTSSTVLRAVRPTPINVADANPVQPP